MKAIILRCQPNSQFHLGRLGLDSNMSLNDTSEHIHSDTLFSALVNICAKAFPDEVGAFIEAFRNGQLNISSGFYCLEIGTQQIYLMPKPVSCNLASTTDHKRLKRVSFISKHVWEKGIKPEEWQEKCFFIQGKFIVLKEEIPSKLHDKIEGLTIYKVHSIPKVSVHKEEKKDNLYYQTNIILGDNKRVSEDIKVHFYFLAEIDERCQDLFGKCLSLFLYEGIGGERSVGCGHFIDLEMKEFQIDVESKYWGTLALTIPNTDHDEFASFRYYQLTTRGGRPSGRKITEDRLEKLKRIKMVLEGAVLDEKPSGKIADISPEGSPKLFLRNGKSFSVPVHSNLTYC